jgi:hypothetical protein
VRRTVGSKPGAPCSSVMMSNLLKMLHITVTRLLQSLIFIYSHVDISAEKAEIINQLKEVTC